MKYRRLGRTALKVSELCLGTMNFGPRTSERESFAILDEAFDMGINFIDTANQYGGHLGVGTTETILGKWLAADGGGRQSDEVKAASTARFEQLAHFASLCDELGQSPSAIALAWTLHQDGIASIIVGPRNREQLVSLANVPELMLSAEVLTRLDAIFPPCGPAPEAYAW